jgi:hypothetical protein
MKRQAIDTAQEVAPRRKTRSDTLPERRAAEESARLEQRIEQETRDREQRAIEQTPFEQALLLVIAEGFLYRYECLATAAVSKSCNDIWQDSKSTFPGWADVEVLGLHYMYIGAWGSSPLDESEPFE